MYSVNLRSHGTALLFSEADNRITSLGASEGGARELFYNMDYPTDVMLVQENYNAFNAALSGEHNCVLRYRQRALDNPTLGFLT